MRRAVILTFVLTLGLGALAGLPACEETGGGPGGAGGQSVQLFTFGADPNAEAMDLLFVIDDSSGMAPKQQALVQAFGRFVEALRASNARRRLPDLHVAVVSTNMGAPRSGRAECIRSDDGLFRFQPRIPGCSAPRGSYLVSLDDGTRNNFAGTLPEAFACIAPLGEMGCPFEQPLAAAWRALGPAHPIENSGFLRPGARLGIVVLADEDDCSAPTDTDLFEPDTRRYGPQRSFRCNEHGHLCGTSPPPRAPTAASIAPCRPAERAGKLTPVGELVSNLTSLGRRLSVVVLGGPPTPYAVTGDHPRVAGDPFDGAVDVAPSCTGRSGPAAPGVRLEAFARAFSSGRFASVCGDDHADALSALIPPPGQSVQCLDQRPSGGSGGAAAAECVATVVRPDEDLGETRLPACAPGAAPPCWRLVDTGSCASGAGLDVTLPDDSGPVAVRLACRSAAGGAAAAADR